MVTQAAKLSKTNDEESKSKNFHTNSSDDPMDEEEDLNEEDIDEDDDYEDEEEDDNKKPKDVEDFFDMYAEQSNGVESSAYTQSDVDSEHIGTEDFLAGYEDVPNRTIGHRKASKHLVSKRIPPIQEMLEFQQPLSEDIDDDEILANDANLNEDILKQSLMPTVKDANLWILKCKAGEELHIANMIFNKYMALQNTENPLNIKSVIFRPHFAGFIYIEAYHQGAVKEAISGISSLKSYEYRDIMTVPVKEMSSVLKIVHDSSINLKPLDFVRIKRGIYKDDLAQILFVDHAQNKVQIKIVPRFKSQTNQINNSSNSIHSTQNNNSQDQVSINGSQDITSKSNIHLQKKNIHYVQKMFCKSDVNGEEIYEEDGFIYYNGNQYSHAGHLIKTFPIVALNITNVEPTLKELSMFQMNDPESIIHFSQPNTKSYLAIDDKVCVISGDLVNLQGKVVKVNNSIISVLPFHKDLNVPIDFDDGELAKTFDIGDHIKVLASKHVNETGLVVACDDSTATILSDSNMQELQIPINLLQLSKMKYSGVDPTGQYSYGDLVQLNERIAGIIIQIESKGFKILNIHGKVMTITKNEIYKKLFKTDTMTFDAYQNTIRRKSSVTVINGQLEGNEGHVLGIFRNFVFVKSKTYNENCGIFVTRGTNLKLSSSNIENSSMSNIISNSGFLHSPKNLTSPGHNIKSKAFNSVYGLGSSQSFTSASIGPRRSSYNWSTFLRNNRELIGQRVRIIRGPYKTYSGIVKAATDSIASIELTAEYKTINVDLTRIALVEPNNDTNLAGNMSAYWNTPYSGNNSSNYPINTPHAALHATPMYDGNRTPRFGSGNQTPSHQTPRQNPVNVEEDSPFSPNAISPSFPSSVESLTDDLSGSLKDSSLYNLNEKSLIAPSPSFNMISSINSEVDSPSGISPSLQDSNYQYNMLLNNSNNNTSTSNNTNDLNSFASLSSSVENPSEATSAYLENNIDWISIGLQVIIKDLCSERSIVGKSGTVRSINGSSISVYIADLQKVTNVAGYFLKPKPGFLGNRVKIILGPHKNKYANIINDTNDLLLVDIDGQYKMVNNTHVCKVDEEYYQSIKTEISHESPVVIDNISKSIENSKSSNISS